MRVCGVCVLTLALPTASASGSLVARQVQARKLCANVRWNNSANLSSGCIGKWVTQRSRCVVCVRRDYAPAVGFIRVYLTKWDFMNKMATITIHVSKGCVSIQKSDEGPPPHSVRACICRLTLGFRPANLMSVLNGPWILWYSNYLIKKIIIDPIIIQLWSYNKYIFILYKSENDMNLVL